MYPVRIMATNYTKPKDIGGGGEAGDTSDTVRVLSVYGGASVKH